MFRPELYFWRLVLMLRKLLEVAVALMFSSTPLFQAWCVSACVPAVDACGHRLCYCHAFFVCAARGLQCLMVGAHAVLFVSCLCRRPLHP